MKKDPNDIILAITIIRDRWMEAERNNPDYQHCITPAIASLVDEGTVTTVYDFLQGDVAAIDKTVAAKAIDDLLSLIQMCSPEHIQQVMTMVTDEKALCDYFVSLNCYEVGVAVKAGVKDFTSLRIISVEHLNTNRIYSTLLEYLSRLPDITDKSIIVLISSFISSLITIIDLCLQDSKKQLSTARG